MKSVRYTFLPKQLEMAHVPHDMALDVCLYVGGFGSGKTHGGVLLGMLISSLYPGSRGLVGASEYTLLRDTTRLKYEELLPESWIRKWGRSPDNLKLSNGSEIWFRSLGEAERLKSKEFNWVHIEEASQVSFETFKMLIGRLRHNGSSCHPDFPELRRSALRKRMFLTTNPEETPGWLYRVFEDGAYRAENGIAPNYRRVHAPTGENNFLLEAQPDYVDRLLQVYDEDYAQIYVYGHTGNMGGRRAYHSFDARANVRTDTEAEGGLPLRLCCDFNVEPMVWVVAQINRQGDVNVLDEIVIENNAQTEAACRLFSKRYGSWGGGLFVYADASGGARSTSGSMTDHDIIRRELGGMRGFKWKVPRRNPTVRDRVIILNGLLCNSRGERRLIVNSRCKYLIRDFNEVTRPRNGVGEIEKVYSSGDMRQKLTHASDALGYMTFVEFPVGRREVPRSYRLIL